MKITKQRLKQIIREEIEALTEDECGKNDNDCREKARAKAAREEGRDAKYEVSEARQGGVMMPNSVLKSLGLGDKYMHDDEDMFLPVSDSDLDSIPDRLRRKYGGKR